ALLVAADDELLLEEVIRAGVKQFLVFAFRLVGDLLAADDAIEVLALEQSSRERNPFVLHEFGADRHAKPLAQDGGDGIGEFDLVADDLVGVTGIAQLERSAPFGIATPTQHAAGETLA